MNAIVLLIDLLPSDVEATDAEIDASIRQVDSDQPVLVVTELAASRGDGIFETLGVVDGHPQAIEAHIARLAHSAAMLDLPEPHPAQWRVAVARAASLLPGTGEEKIKLVISRGIEGAGVPTAWVLAETVTASHSERQTGIRVVTLDRGLRSDVAQTAPWLLAGAKTLSYAMNMASLREARRRGADDVIFTSSDGFVLEGPTSSVVIRHGEEFVTPRTDAGILAGTTQLSLFAYLQREGFVTTERMVPVTELAETDGIWLLSSSRLAAGVTSVDGRPLVYDSAFTERMNEALLARED